MIDFKPNRSEMTKLQKQLNARFEQANSKMETWVKQNPSASEGKVAATAHRIYRGAGVSLSNSGRDYAREVTKRRNSA